MVQKWNSVLTLSTSLAALSTWVTKTSLTFKSGGDVVNNAANIGDVTRISKANDLHIAPTSSDRQGETTTSYAYDASKIRNIEIQRW